MKSTAKNAVVLFVAVGLFAAPVVQAAQPIWTDHNEHDPGVAAPHAPGERGGTEDINIGVGELGPANNETEFAFLRERASIARGDVRN